MKDLSFLNSEKIFRREYVVETYNTSYFQTIKVSDLFKYLQEVASQHSEIMKIGFDDLKDNKGAWVLTKQLLEVKRLPNALEKFTIHTWSRELNKIVANRNFIVMDKQNNIIIRATSDWVVLNLEKRRIIPLSKLNLDSIQSYDYDLFSEPLTKINIISANLINEFTKKVRFSDIDINGHMNNTCYVDMVLDSMAEYFDQRHSLQLINTNFLQEVKFLEDIAIKTYQVETNIFHHQIIRNNDGCEVFTAITEWEK
jgi:acyl-ACP thioesterase